jgi:hypothetical protein
MLPVRDQRSGSGPRPKVIPAGFCYAFHKQGKCKARECAFKHICFLCGAQNSVLKFEKKEQQLALLTELARGKKRGAVKGGPITDHVKRFIAFTNHVKYDFSRFTNHDISYNR